MPVIEILGFAASILIGVSLGLIGGGGSILTVPVLVYMIHIDPVLATAYSLFVVGSTALVGSVNFLRKGLVSLKTAVIFAIPSFISVFVTRKFVIPAIPDPVFSLGGFPVTKDLAIMVLFAVIMLVAAWSMIRDKKENKTIEEKLSYNYPMIALEGLVVGALTGLVGAGGGFLIIPALVLLAHIPMKLAVGTSLLIIAAKSLIGFTGDLGTQPIDWPFMLIFTSLSIGGLFLGEFLSRFISGAALKKGFGYFVLVMAVFILTKELIF
ncbi:MULTISPECIES: sulfite exporter TauE/SafE family protein [unclassified Imperialibacter]|uniref:sulfite exporter TauE/SafE family protein n=1 Tax=unclassified Imperialibacter TaxID=2629706 RepID=UPI00125C1FC8|nr:MULTISPECIES: sulfite exporter TauE/SafE family protein [unclassified Imperialibacter]CAD5270787.1 putative membrane transporter protein [Imperialibacter sp. 89]CAD5298424.1 putative membrane transporter protein [Imperialibacter sp. 75]VVT34907.1 putative membrane transporter protein [Imperialibacter sp. EC-SDR9]